MPGIFDSSLRLATTLLSVKVCTVHVSRGALGILFSNRRMLKGIKAGILVGYIESALFFCCVIPGLDHKASNTAALTWRVLTMRCYIKSRTTPTYINKSHSLLSWSWLLFQLSSLPRSWLCHYRDCICADFWPLAVRDLITLDLCRASILLGAPQTDLGSLTPHFCI
jgi:hypothetical protein